MKGTGKIGVLRSGVGITDELSEMVHFCIGIVTLRLLIASKIKTKDSKISLN